jgi:biopolymer transport protein ExbD
MDTSFGGLGSDTLLGRKTQPETPEFDITAMVDLVFLMNLYFLVTFITVALAEINLPTANHCEPLDSDEAVILTVLGSLDGKSVTVSSGEGDEAVQLGDADQQGERIAAAVEKGVSAGKDKVLIKAEKKVRLGELFRVARAAANPGVKLHVAVVESD